MLQTPHLAISEEALEEFLRLNYAKEVRGIYSDKGLIREAKILRISHCRLLDAIPSANPDQVLVHRLELAVQRIQVECSEDLDGIFKPCIRILISDLPLSCPFYTKHVPQQDSVGRLITFTGIVIRTSARRACGRYKTYVCCVCKHRQTIDADDWQGGFIPKPTACSGLIDDGDRKCPSTKFKASIEPIECDDVQEVRIQETINDVGRVPRSLLVVLKNQLVDQVQVGQRVAVTGQVIARWKQYRSSCIVDLALIANRVEDLGGKEATRKPTGLSTVYSVSELVSSFCPFIYGLQIVKLSILLAVASCYRQRSLAKNSARNNIHVLLIGDPGTAKSQLLRGAACLVPRSVVTTGSGSTTAGLTLAVIKESTTGPNSHASEWSLEAGALTQADGSLCCIDEFLAIRASDRGAIHEAMEQQCISVSKAGINCSVPSRCSIIAACNGGGPKGEGHSGQDIDSQYSDYGTMITGNIALASPLLSRFDLILALNQDSNRQLIDHEWDERLCDAILQSKMKTRSTSSLITNEHMIEYFSSRSHINVQLTPAAQRVLGAYFEKQRQADFRNAARTTTRLLESLVRMTEAYAWLRGQSQWACVEDASWAVWLMDSSIPSQVICSRERHNLLRDVLPDTQQVVTLVTRRLSLIETIIAQMDSEFLKGCNPASVAFMDFDSSQAAI